MREIKFRAWDVFDKTMEEDAQAKCWLSQGFDQEEFKDSYAFMQYTGLKDKNGKEIYEGDILRYIYYHLTKGQLSFINEVVFYQGNGRYAVEYMDGEHHYFGETVFQNTCEIIGNIYENPELLNSDKEVQRSVARDDDSSTSDNKQKNEIH